MSIKCGSCKGRHESVAEVRLCAGVGGHTDASDAAWNANVRTARNLDEQRTRQNDYGHEPHTRGYDMERSWGRTPMPAVEAGWYALRDAEGVVKFYQVDVPQEGRWVGWTFLAALASDERHPIKNVTTKREILTRIAEAPRQAMELFGREIGQCGKCHRTLTDEESRRIGIGPVCREKL